MNFPQHSLASLGTIQTGSTPRTAEQAYWGGDTPFVTPAELDQDVPVFSTPRTLSEQGVQQSRLLEEGAVMVCCIGSLGKVGMAGRAVVTNQQINSIEFDRSKVFPKYGFYACRRLKRTLISMAPATTIPIVSKSKFAQLEIPLPPLPEQRRIAAILDQADVLRAKRREGMAQLDSLAQSIFFEMFGDSVARAAGWPISILKALGKVSTGGTPPSGRDGMFGGPIPFLTPGDLESDATPKRSVTEAGAGAAATVRAGATLVCCIGATIGKTDFARVRSAFNQQLNGVEWGTSVHDVYGLYSMRLLKPVIVSRGASTTLPILKKSAFEKLEIVVPPLGLQQTFATRIKAIESLKTTHRAALAEADALFAALQHRAFAGQLS